MSALSAVTVLAASSSSARELNFETRVQAETAIERVYYRHQIGATKPFEEAVPRAVIEQKVRTYLKQSMAVERYWNTQITAAMLDREVERMARQTRMPERLRELFAALGNDAFFVRECLARPALVDRLARSYFANDALIHAEAREKATALREQLVLGRVDLNAAHEYRRPSLIVSVGGVAEKKARPRLRAETNSARLELAAEEFRSHRQNAPKRVGDIGPVVEGRDDFTIQELQDETPDRFRVASYFIPKRSWDDWWLSVREQLDETKVAATQVTGGALPNPSGSVDGFDPQSAPCFVDDTWNNGTPDDVPDSRYGHTAIWTGSLMVVWGGAHESNPPTSINTGGRYDPATDTWAPTSTVNAPSPRSGATAVWTGSLMVIWGGGAYENTGGRYDPAADTWNNTSLLNAPSGRAFHTEVWTGSGMVVWGGVNNSGALQSGGRYDPTADTWTPTSSANAPLGRYGHTAVWSGNWMVVWGGVAVSGSVVNTGGRYDPATDAWTTTSTVNAPASRNEHAAVWTGSTMVVWGGRQISGSPVNTGGRYEPKTDLWTPTTTVNAPSARRRHTAIWTGSQIVVWGGLGGGSTGGNYHPVTDVWTQTSVVNAPSARSSHTAVWTGTMMVAWSGKGGSNTGGRYDPLTDTWTPTSTGAGPTERFAHSAIWTGSVMVVWGGWNKNTGGRYDPAIDTWTPTTTTNAPPGRGEHTAVWTGELMVVWGGTLNGSSENADMTATGGRYDPVRDEWAPTSVVGAPDAREWHTAVWTGNKMVVWGGYVGGIPGVINTGGRYDPASDTWAPTTLMNAPSARSFPTSVWTGSRMVVWGGYQNVGCFNTGGRYDPVLDVWTPTGGAAPEARVWHTSVWTGKEMIVWGGQGGCTNSYWYLNSGGRYNPTTNSWTPITTVNAPEIREQAEAVWSGKTMVVWGGDNDFSSGMNTGGRYDPEQNSWAPVSTVNAPPGRIDHTAVWTGSFMIVWGGSGLTSGGRYALGHTDDDDGDGFTECAGDCNDGQVSIFPGAAESCDELDNDCNGIADEADGDGDGVLLCMGDCNDTDPGAHHVASEVAGFAFGEDKATLSWTSAVATAGSGTVHDVVRGMLDGFPVGSGSAMTEMCLAPGIAGTLKMDSEVPDVGSGFWYLVRGRNTCGLGTYGAESDGGSRFTNTCP